MKPQSIKHYIKCLTLSLIVTVLLPNETLAATAAAAADNGTDPRDFASKFMPYYRYTELKNGLQQSEVVMFGLFSFSKKFAMTYEIPLAMERDVNDTSLKNPNTGTCGGSLSGGGFVLPNGLPAEGDCEETGVGDMNLRFMYRAGHAAGGDWLIGTEMWFPTATNDVLGSEQFRLAPMVTYVRDMKIWPAPGAFVALMNFYEFDVFGESSRGDVSMYKGRWFVMMPLSPSGWYALPEFQPIYDFENKHFSLWVGPEVGKLLAPGRIAYIKPGFSYNPSSSKGDRDWTIEAGFRWFLDIA